MGWEAVPNASSVVPLAQAEERGRFLAALVGGFFVAVIGALVWAAISLFTNYQVGFLAIAVGFAVGLAVRLFGRRRSAAFGVLGALLALVGILLGNLFFYSAAIAQTEGLAVIDVFVLLLVNPDVLVEVFAAAFELIDLLFYGLALYVGYRTAMPRLVAVTAPEVPAP